MLLIPEIEMASVRVSTKRIGLVVRGDTNQGKYKIFDSFKLFSETNSKPMTNDQ
ncbi:hypothetical protein ACFOG5_21545 [Pedobacter fastidiosus]|uniref:hypothetical protein n=1 Tax=Pedobacter fastidiosus TaxID=2765361 RepID=UPI00361D2595